MFCGESAVPEQKLAQTAAGRISLYDEPAGFCPDVAPAEIKKLLSQWKLPIALENWNSLAANYGQGRCL